jgi:dihydroorotate dehydrogenase electron transfer subunit
MSRKVKETITIVSQEQIGSGIYSMWVQTGSIAAEAKAGQFVSLYINNGGKLLPRPISICEIDREHGKLRFVYRVTGKGTGTEALSQMRAGESLSALGPLGNGFPLEAAKGKKSIPYGRRHRYPAYASGGKRTRCRQERDPRIPR